MISSVAVGKVVGALIDLIGAATLRQIVNHFGKMVAITINEFIFKIARPHDELFVECQQCNKKYYYNSYRGFFRDMKVCGCCSSPLDIPKEILDKEYRDLKNVQVS